MGFGLFGSIVCMVAIPVSPLELKSRECEGKCVFPLFFLVVRVLVSARVH